MFNIIRKIGSFCAGNPEQGQGSPLTALLEITISLNEFFILVFAFNDFSSKNPEYPAKPFRYDSNVAFGSCATLTTFIFKMIFTCSPPPSSRSAFWLSLLSQEVLSLICAYATAAATQCLSTTIDTASNPSLTVLLEDQGAYDLAIKTLWLSGITHLIIGASTVLLKCQSSDACISLFRYPCRQWLAARLPRSEAQYNILGRDNSPEPDNALELGSITPSH